MCCGVLQCVAVCCSVLQCVAVCCILCCSVLRACCSFIAREDSDVLPRDISTNRYENRPRLTRFTRLRGKTCLCKIAGSSPMHVVGSYMLTAAFRRIHDHVSIQTYSWSYVKRDLYMYEKRHLNTHTWEQTRTCTCLWNVTGIQTYSWWYVKRDLYMYEKRHLNTHTWKQTRTCTCLWNATTGWLRLVGSWKW